MHFSHKRRRDSYFTDDANIAHNAAIAGVARVNCNCRFAG